MFAGVSGIERAADLTPQQVAEFLDGIGLGQYVQAFLDAGVDGDAMQEVRDNDLKDVGVQSRLHQVKIITLFKRLVSGRSQTRCDHQQPILLCLILYPDAL